MQATKLVEDSLLSVRTVKEGEELVLESEDAYFLRFSLSEIPMQKKTARGVSLMSLRKGDGLKAVYLLSEQSEVQREDKSIALSRLKQGKRGGKGTKRT